jgi:hypothetical protein
LGIAATALNNWPEARRAWNGYGLKLPAGEGPIEADLGLTPIRLNPTGGRRSRLVQRIDPARAIIDSVPFPDSGHRHGDLLLHDGEPKVTGSWVVKRYPFSMNWNCCCQRVWHLRRDD